MGAISLCSTMPKYGEYREAWHLLREAAGEPHFSQNQGEMGHPAVNEREIPAGPAVARMQTAGRLTFSPAHSAINGRSFTKSSLNSFVTHAVRIVKRLLSENGFAIALFGISRFSAVWVCKSPETC